MAYAKIAVRLDGPFGDVAAARARSIPGVRLAEPMDDFLVGKGILLTLDRPVGQDEFEAALAGPFAALPGASYVTPVDRDFAPRRAPGPPPPDRA